MTRDTAAQSRSRLFRRTPGLLGIEKKRLNHVILFLLFSFSFLSRRVHLPRPLTRVGPTPFSRLVKLAEVISTTLL